MKSQLNRFLRYFAYIFFLVVILLGGWLLIPASVHYQMTESYRFTSQEAASVALGVILPVSGPYQEVRHSLILWDGEPTALPVFGEARLQGKVQPGKDLVFTIQYQVILRQGAARWDAPVEDNQLKPEKDIESDQAEFIALATRLAQGVSRRDAFALYAFTSSTLSWPKGTRLGASQSALAAYETGIGGCAEFANLMVSLCRAADIPARSITGLALPAYPPLWKASSTWSHPGGAHAWVEVFTGQQWELADPSWGSSWPGFLKRLWFGRNDGSHLSYGETGDYQQRYAVLTGWAEEQGALIGAMSNPLHFVASADAEQATVIPSVVVKKGWDGRWVITGSIYLILFVSIRSLENRFRKV